MNWFHLSIIGNIILLVVLGYLALDRKSWNNRLERFKETCILRHNPIDEAIKRIDSNISKIWDRIDKLSNRG